MKIALTHNTQASLNNICIVLFSILIGSLVFKEKLSKVNFAGIILAMAAILILMKS